MSPRLTKVEAGPTYRSDSNTLHQLRRVTIPDCCADFIDQNGRYWNSNGHGVTLVGTRLVQRLYEARDVTPGKVFTAIAPVMTITPLRSSVTVDYVDLDGYVYYRWGRHGRKETPMQRFLFIINDPRITRL